MNIIIIIIIIIIIDNNYSIPFMNMYQLDMSF